MRHILFVLMSVAVPATDATAAPPREISRDVPTNGKGIAESENFVVRTFAVTIKAKEVADGCEGWRRHLAKKWLNENEPKAWQPKCEVCVHANRQSYLRSVGSGGVQTFGSSLVDYGGGRASRRRIDLLIDTQGQLSALPHELTHVVVADAFAGRQPPAWLDEGIATLSDTERKQALHRRDCQSAIESRSTIRLVQLLTLNGLSRDQRAAFYGQSLSLVGFLCKQNGSDRLIPFAHRAMAIGYDRALSEQFKIDSVGELERLWRNYATDDATNSQFSTASYEPAQRR